MLRLAVFVVLMTAGLAAALVNRFAALLVYIWFALFRPQEWVWFDISGLRLSLVLGVLLIVPSLLTGVLPAVTNPLGLGSMLFLAAGLVAQTNAVQPDVGWQWLDFFGRLVLVSLFLISLVNTKRRFVLCVAVVAGSLGYHTAKAGLASLAGGGLQFADGLAGAFSDNNGYAMGTVMIIPLLLGAAQNLTGTGRAEAWARRAFYAAVPLSAFTVISTYSRGGFLALAATAMALVLVQRRRLLILTVLTLGLLVTVPLLPISERYLARMETIRTYEEIDEGSALSRLHFWGVAIEMAKQQPLGVGLFNYQAAYDRYDDSGGVYGTARSVHSSHFQVLAETGFLGLAIWIGLFVGAFRLIWKIRGRARLSRFAESDRRFLTTMSNALMASMCGYLVGGSFIALALNDLTWLTFALVAALDRLSIELQKSPVATAGTGTLEPSAAIIPVAR